ncbi:MAG: efflux RND transporter periplasmic adaptor subunit [Aphanocapsa sp. GSE-SYN-MK-11-07L]|jgi:RND family efflux transporter MFP subunit|nr:efflux RND transporter periplasmic adaptor subunit [Aphanocapsa sp. GSE-SYN-MK-11-07L]
MSQEQIDNPPPDPSRLPVLATAPDQKAVTTISADRLVKNPWLWLLLLIGLSIGGITLWRSFSAERPATKTAGPPPRPVELVRLKAGTGIRQVQLIGQVEASQQATVRAQTDGVIEQVLVNSGDRVSPGMAIAILDDADQALAVAQAKAQLAQERSNLARLEVGTRPEIIAQRRAALQSAKAREQENQDNLNRTQELVKQGAVSERLLVEARTALDDAKGARLAAAAALAEAVAGPIRPEIEAQRANVAAALAAVNQAKLSLRRTQITTPAAGIVQIRQVSPGDFVESADPIISLVAGDRLDIFLELPENLTGQVGPGAAIALTARALPQWQGRATITGVVPVAEASSRRQRVRVRLGDPPPGLLPGMSIEGQLALLANSPGFVVSRDALTRRQDEWVVYTVAEGKAKQIEVDLLADMGEQVSIASPQLRVGESIVLRGGDGLREGAAVKVVKPQS